MGFVSMQLFDLALGVFMYAYTYVAVLYWVDVKKLNSESLKRWLIALNLPPQLLNTLLFLRWSI